ncbi:hypothetical protein [Streptomyces sp. NPDC054765]
MRVTVYAGSALGNRPAYQEAASVFAKELAAAGHEIVYGGGAAGGRYPLIVDTLIIGS